VLAERSRYKAAVEIALFGTPRGTGDIGEDLQREKRVADLLAAATPDASGDVFMSTWPRLLSRISEQQQPVDGGSSSSGSPSFRPTPQQTPQQTPRSEPQPSSSTTRPPGVPPLPLAAVRDAVLATPPGTARPTEGSDAQLLDRVRQVRSARLALRERQPSPTPRTAPRTGSPASTGRAAKAQLLLGGADEATVERLLQELGSDATRPALREVVASILGRPRAAPQ
jgi:hypothetical protein